MPARLLCHWTISVLRSNVNRATMCSYTGCLQGLGLWLKSTHSPLTKPGVGLLLSQRKWCFSSKSTKVAKWTNKNLSHSLQKAWILLILKTSYLGILDSIFAFSVSTTVLHEDLAVYKWYYPGSLWIAAWPFPLNASKNMQRNYNSLVVPQCRKNGCWISEASRRF